MKTKLFLLISFYFLTSALYRFFTSIPTSNHLMTNWDKFVPVIPIFVVPYLFATIMFFAFPLYLLFKSKTEIFYSYLTTQSIASILSYLVFAIFPTSVIRDPITQKTGLFADGLRQIHAFDRPSAAFPSGHVFYSTIIAYFLWIYYPKSRFYVAVTLPIIIISTVTLKQHYSPDILGGLVVALLAIYLEKLLSSFLLKKKFITK